jgi:hypothetical protein
MEELTVTTALERADADAARINSVRRLFDPDEEDEEPDDEKDDEDD